MLAKKWMFLFFLLLGGVAYAGPLNVKVGFFAYSGYHEMSPKGEKSGYDYEMYRGLSRYANLNFQFVGFDKSWDDMLKMLENGEIDMVSPATRTKELEERFSCSRPV